MFEKVKLFKRVFLSIFVVLECFHFVIFGFVLARLKLLVVLGLLF